MSTGRGRGGNATTRSPPRMAEDRDATVVLRATRGTGLPPRILSSGRPRGGIVGRRGGARGGHAGDGYIVRPHGGSIPPWAIREKAADTYRPDYRSPPPVDRGQEGDSRPTAEKEPSSRPKWERESEKKKDSVPPPPPEYLSSSPAQPVSRSDMNGTSMGYSAGPSHQRWMRPEAEAGPSRYSVDESRPDPATKLYSAVSSPVTSRTQSRNGHPLGSSTSEVHKSIQWEAITTGSEHVTRPPDLSETSWEEGRSAIQDEKEDTYLDPPKRTSRRTSTPQAEEKAVEVDVKPDVSAVIEAEVPVILEEDREDGVLAVKRDLVLQCYEKNPTVRSAARKAFRVQKTAELSAIGRIVQHVLWRDDGVGVQWKKARSTRSPTKAAEPALPAPSPPPIIDISPPDRPKTPSPVAPKSTIPSNPVTVKIEPGLSTPATMAPNTKSKPLPQTPAQDPSGARAQPDAGPSRRSPIKIALPPPSAQKPVSPNILLHKSDSDIDTNKRKAVEESPIPKAPKPPKQPKVDQPPAANALSAAQHREKLDRQAEVRRNLAAEQEANAMNGPCGTPDVHKKKKGKSRGNPSNPAQERRRQKNREKLAEKHAQRDAARAVGEQQGPGSAPTTSNALPGTADRSTGRAKGKARDTVDLTIDDPVVPRLAGSSAAKEKTKTKDIVDLTKDVKANPAKIANPKPPSAPAKRAYSPSRPAPLPSAPSGSRQAAIVRPPPSAPPAMKPKPIPNPIPTSRPTTAPARPQPIRPPTSVRPPPTKTLPIRPPLRPTSTARPPPQTTSIVRPATARVIPLGPSHPLATAEASRPPPQPTVQPQYHAQAAGGSYTERQALAALAARAPQVGQQARPPVTKFTPRPAAGLVPARPPAPRPPTRIINAGRPTSSSSPLGGIDTLPSTPRYEELRRQLSSKMEEIDNWTSMLTDLPDRAEMTQRQIDRTRQECFELQKQMREEKEKAR